MCFNSWHIWISLKYAWKTDSDLLALRGTQLCFEKLDYSFFSFSWLITLFEYSLLKLLCLKTIISGIRKPGFNSSTFLKNSWALGDTVECHQHRCEELCALLAHVLGKFVLSFTVPLQMAFIIVAGICLCLYFLFLCFMVFQVFRNISGKQSSLPAMSKVRRLHYEVSSYLSLF